MKDHNEKDKSLHLFKHALETNTNMIATEALFTHTVASVCHFKTMLQHIQTDLKLEVIPFLSA